MQAKKKTLALFSFFLNLTSLDNISRRNYYHKLAYKSSDVDLFIYGIDDEQKANEKIQEIYDAVIQSIPCSALAFRSTHAITIVSQVGFFFRIVRAAF
jgi:hypothetical protein